MNRGYSRRYRCRRRGRCGAQSASAHHSFAAEFDANSPIELTGTVTKVAWANPHTFFYIDVTTPKGEVENWALEMGSPNGLMRRGWTRDSMKIGDVVSVDGLAREGRQLQGQRSLRDAVERAAPVCRLEPGQRRGELSTPTPRITHVRTTTTLLYARLR